MEFKAISEQRTQLTEAQCSRTRLEFKVEKKMQQIKTAWNAVAPDWNLKVVGFSNSTLLKSNAVAPDWNLKYTNTLKEIERQENAVAPDWNLKHGQIVQRYSRRTNAVAPDWNLKLHLLCRVPTLTFNAVAPDWNLKKISRISLIVKPPECSRTRLEFKVYY